MARTPQARRKLVDSELAAIYWVMLHHPKEAVQHVSQGQIAKAKRTIYDLVKQGKIKNHGGPKAGQGRFCLIELHKVYNTRASG